LLFCYFFRLTSLFRNNLFSREDANIRKDAKTSADSFFGGGEAWYFVISLVVTGIVYAVGFVRYVRSHTEKQREMKLAG